MGEWPKSARSITRRRVIFSRTINVPATESFRHVDLRRLEFRNSRVRWGFAFLLLFVTFSCACFAADTNQAPANSFPTPAEVFQGRQFTNKLERDVFFLRTIQEKYPDKWPTLLNANISEDDYVRAPDKLLRFVNELAIAERNRNDAAASTCLALITDAPQFFANTNAYHPEILHAAAQALMDIGPNGRKVLANCFSQGHYRIDSESLEELAKVIAKEKSDDPGLAKALAAVAFDFTTTNGGIFPRCTTEITKDLLCLPHGGSIVKTHLKADEIISDPARFQSVIDGISSANATDLTTNLTAVEPGIKTKLATLTNSPGDYRDDLQDLENRIQKTVATFENSSQIPAKP